MIRVRKIKTKTGIIYEATATGKGLSARSSKKKKALSKLARKIDIADFVDGFKSFFKKDLRNK